MLVAVFLSPNSILKMLRLPHLFSSLLAVTAIAIGFSSAGPLPIQTESDLEKRAVTTFTNHQVFYPPTEWPSWRTLYAHSLQLPDSSLLLTFEQYAPEPETFPVYRSTDAGQTWSNYSQVHDQKNGWGMRYQPHLHMLEQDLGAYKAGTILIAGPSLPSSLNGGVYIDLYASTDNAKTWKFVSHIAYGAGPETINNGDKAIWEPFFLFDNGQLICYYSDQRDPAHAQKIVYTTTKDLVNWSATTDAIAFSTYSQRPGMPVVAKIKSTGRYIMTFEYCGGPGGSGCPVWYTIADSPLQFNSAPKAYIQGGGVIPNGSPYVTWYQYPGSSNGVIIASGNNREELFINNDVGNTDTWKKVDVGMWSAYSRSLRVVNFSGQDKLFIGNGGNMADPSTTHNYVACGLINIPQY